MGANMAAREPGVQSEPLWVQGGGTRQLSVLTTNEQRPSRNAHEHLVRIPAGDVALEGLFTRPIGVEGLVIIACGSGTGRSPRMRELARGLQHRCLATLVVDLLPLQERDVELTERWWVSGTALLGARLAALTEALTRAPAVSDLPLGYLGLNTGASAALAAAAIPPRQLAAVVCLGGRVDRSAATLAAVRPPTLFLVGGQDTTALQAAERALLLMTNVRNITVMPGVSPRLEEQGAIDRVIDLAGSWLLQHLRRSARTTHRLLPSGSDPRPCED
jgi:putative phosphoribosyl transferase